MEADSGSRLLDWLGLLVNTLTPLLLCWVGFRGHAYVDQLARRRRLWEVEFRWRLEVFRELVGNLNDLFCYFTYQGKWRKMTPDDATEAKWASDRLVHGNEFLWSGEFLKAYDAYKAAAFCEKQGRGKLFLFRANVSRQLENEKWEESWRRRFVPEEDRLRRRDFIRVYRVMMALAARDIGVAGHPRG